MNSAYDASIDIFKQFVKETVYSVYYYDIDFDDIYIKEGNTEKISSKIIVVLDANVFIDIKDSVDNESKFLLSDWLQEEIILLITKEIYNEIERNSDRKERKRARAFASNLNELPADIEIFDEKVELLKQIFPGNLSSSDESDMRQLAWTIAGNAQFFVTRDSLLLDKGDILYEKFGVSVMRPSDLVRRIDEIINESKYQPARLAGSQLKINHVKSGNELVLKKLFLCYNQGETRVQFESKLRPYLADTKSFQVYIVRDNHNNPLALIIYDKSQSNVITVPMFRVVKSYLASTVARYLIKKIVLDSINNGQKVTYITETHLLESVKSALIENGFLFYKDKWVKYSFKGFFNQDTLVKRLTKLGSEKNVNSNHILEVIEYINDVYKSNIKKILFTLEKTFWPVKIMDIGLPNYLVPINPSWAIKLFDEKMAKSTLFGVPPDLLLRNDNVYYRSRKPNNLVAPARILWYVTDGENHGSKRLRACSHLDDIDIDYPKSLYRKYKRLGVYDWDNVYRTAKKDINEKIMAVKFSNSEIFENTISWRTLKKVLIDLENREAPIQSPVNINDETFVELYRIGNKLEVIENDF